LCALAYQGHGEKLGIPSHVVQGVLSVAFDAWQRCFKKLAKKPRLKSRRNRMASIPFPDPIKAPKDNYIGVPGLGTLRFHRMEFPAGKIKFGRIVKRASGWYLCLFIAAAPKEIERTGYGEIGIDPGFASPLTTSSGEVIEHPREYEAVELRLAQAQRRRDHRLAARLQERVANVSDI
jgi:putative transposase